MVYNVLIIGAGNIGCMYDRPDSSSILTHAHAVDQSDELELVGFYDIDFEKARQAAERWGGGAYRSLKDITTPIDIVCVAVPDQYHYMILKKIITMNIRLVIVEKPITLFSAEAKEIIKLYKEKNIVLQINYSRRFLKEYKDLKLNLNSMGALITGVGYYGKGLFHNGSHMIDLLSFLFDQVKFLSSEKGYFDFYVNDESKHVRLNVLDKKVDLYPVPCDLLTIFELDLLFAMGRIRIVDSGCKIELYEVKDNYTEKNYSLFKTIQVDYGEAIPSLYKNCIDAIEGKDKVICTAESALETLIICEQGVSRIE